MSSSETRLDRGAAAFRRLCRIMQRLRAPDGCAWDRAQTMDSLKPYLIEEAYEVVDAVEAGDPEAHLEELGDLLLQIVFQAEIAAESGHFDIAAVADGIANKLLRRHPHVFDPEQRDPQSGSLRQWEALKAQERAATRSGARSCLDGIPRSLPGLIRAYRTGEKAAAVGFDWEDADGTKKKCEEEWRELQSALKNRSNTKEIEEEFGDLLFSLVNLSRHIAVDPDAALRRAIDKFHTRFQKVEAKLAEVGQSPSEVSLDRLNGLWEEVKTR